MAELRIGIITCSDSRALAGAEDTAGRALMDACESRGWVIIAYHVCPNEAECISTSIIELADAEEADVVLTIGGTSLGPHDVTPDATASLCERFVPGIAEAIRSRCVLHDPSFVLSRGVVGVRGSTLIVNLPGGDGPALEGFAAAADHLETAVARLSGADES